jgi:hypothetical protein
MKPRWASSKSCISLSGNALATAALAATVCRVAAPLADVVSDRQQTGRGVDEELEISQVNQVFGTGNYPGSS